MVESSACSSATSPLGNFEEAERPRSLCLFSGLSQV